MARRAVWLTVVACAAFVLAHACLFFLAERDRDSATFFTVWAAAPYVGYCTLALLVSRSKSVSTSVLIAALSGGAATFAAFCVHLLFATGPVPNGADVKCSTDALPGVELGLPVIHWAYVAWLTVVSLASKALYERASRAGGRLLSVAEARRFGGRVGARSEGITSVYRRLSA